MYRLKILYRCIAKHSGQVMALSTCFTLLSPGHDSHSRLGGPFESLAIYGHWAVLVIHPSDGHQGASRPLAHRDWALHGPDVGAKEFKKVVKSTFPPGTIRVNFNKLKIWLLFSKSPPGPVVEMGRRCLFSSTAVKPWAKETSSWREALNEASLPPRISPVVPGSSCFEDGFVCQEDCRGFMCNVMVAQKW